MNRKIEQLTRNYLDSLSLYAYSTYLEENQKRKIISLNDKTNWIIFCKDSLRNEFSSGADGTFSITSEPLKKLLQEQLKIYHAPNWKDIFLGPNDDPNSISLNDIQIELLNVLRSEWISNWIAVDKTAIGNGFGTVTNDIDNIDLTIGTTQIKSNWNLDDLLNDPVITSSVAPSTNNNDNNDRERQNSQREETSPPNDNNYLSSSQTQTPPFNPTPQTITSDPFIIAYFEQVQPSQVAIYPRSLWIRGQFIEVITICGKKAKAENRNFQVGSKIKITDIQFGSGEAAWIENGELILLSRTFDRIVVGEEETPNPNPRFFDEVQRKNREITAENDNLALLVYDLLEIIEKNNQLCQKAEKEKGLILTKIQNPDGSPLDLTDFNNALETLDENFPLSAPVNQQILNQNQGKKQRKIDLANILKKVWKKNQADYQNFSPNSPDNSEANDLKRKKPKLF